MQQAVAQQPAPEPIEALSAEPQPEEKPKNRIQGFFERIRRHEGQPQADGWLGHDDDDDNPLWRGGATTRAGLRLVGEDEGQATVQDAVSGGEGEVAGEQGQDQAPTEEDLRDAVLGLQDDELLARDVWFVALGSNSLGHVGMKSFLAAHGEELASALLINLDCIGAGSLAVLGNEGLVSTRTANSRVCGLVKGAIEDLHGTCSVVPHDWEDTDATPAMRSYLRAATVMGVVGTTSPRCRTARTTSWSTSMATRRTSIPPRRSPRRSVAPRAPDVARETGLALWRGARPRRGLPARPRRSRARRRGRRRARCRTPRRYRCGERPRARRRTP